MSEYLHTIACPEECYGAKIPDSNQTPSFVVHCVQRIQVTAVAAAGTPTAGLTMVVGSLGASAVAGADYYVGQGTAVAGAIAWSPFAKSYASQLTNQQAYSIRPVSASLQASYQGATNTDQGRFVVVVNPGPNYGSLGFSLPATSTAQLALPFVTDLPVAKRYVRGVYLPSDDISRSYSFAGNGNFPYRTNPGAATAGTQYGTICVFADGIVVGSIVEFTLTENFECIPISGLASYVSPTPSKSDPIELSMATNAIQARPQFAVEQKQGQMATATAIENSSSLVRPAMSAKPSHEGIGEETFFERVMNGVEKYGPLVARGAKLLGSLL